MKDGSGGGRGRGAAGAADKRPGGVRKPGPTKVGAAGAGLSPMELEERIRQNRKQLQDVEKQVRLLATSYPMESGWSPACKLKNCFGSQ